MSELNLKEPPTPSADAGCSGADLVTVCDKCLQASCWQGVFMCWESRAAGTVQKTRRELEELNLENPSWLKTDLQLASA